MSNERNGAIMLAGGNTTLFEQAMLMAGLSVLLVARHGHPSTKATDSRSSMGRRTPDRTPASSCPRPCKSYSELCNSSRNSSNMSIVCLKSRGCLCLTPPSAVRLVEPAREQG